MPSRTNSGRLEYLILWGVNAAIFAGLLFYALTDAFIWDESFHLLAARLIRLGEKPYLDFCFPQTPLNAYLNAALLALFGDHWQPSHALSAFFTACAVFLIADFVYRNLPDEKWRLAAAIFASTLSVSMFTLIAFAMSGQAYAICMAFIAASFRFAVASARSSRIIHALAAGLCAGIAAASSMLVAAAVPVLLIWTVVVCRASLWKSGAAFVAGAAIPFAPVVWLFSIAPGQTLFNVVFYQARYRNVNWNGTAPHDVEVFLGLGQSPGALLLLLLAAGGVVWIARSGWPRQARLEFFLAAGIAAAIGVESLVAHPTFERYFILTIPFFAIPAAVGFFAAGSKLAGPWRALIPMLAIFALSIANGLYQDSESMRWSDLEKVAAKVAEVSPPGSMVYADEMVYFLTGLPVPEGIQFSYNHRLALPVPEEKLYHVISQAHLDDQVRARRFATVETCTEGDAQRLKLDQIYAHHAEVGDCKVFWGR